MPTQNFDTVLGFLAAVRMARVCIVDYHWGATDGGPQTARRRRRIKGNGDLAECNPTLKGKVSP